MKKGHKLWLVGLAIAVGIALSVAVVDHFQSVRIQRTIAQTQGLCGQVPTEASRTDVESFLDRKGFEHAYIGESKKWPEYARTESAIIRDVCGKHRLVTCGVVLTFKFDQRELLKNCSAKVVYTGP